MPRVRLLTTCVILLLTGAIAVGQTKPVADSPKATLRGLATAMREGDAPAIRQILLSENELGTEMIESTAMLAEATASLRRSAIDHFGPEGARDLIGSVTAEQEAARIDAGVEQIDGEKATVQLGTEPPIELSRVDGAWRVPVMSLAAGMDPAILRSRLTQQTALVLVIRQTSTDVTAGHYKSAAEARQSLYKQVSAIVEEEEAQPVDQAATTAPTTQP